MFYKKGWLLLAVAAMCIVTTNATAQVGIGTNSPNPKAALELRDTSRGFLLPRMSTSQRVALGATLTSADIGMLVGDTTSSSGGLFVWGGSGWNRLLNGPLNFAGSDFTGVLPVSRGGTGTGASPGFGQIPIGNGSGYTLNNVTPGIGISIGNSPGTITLTNSLPENTTAGNGLTLIGSQVRLGGNLLSATTIGSSGFNMTFDGPGSLLLGTGARLGIQTTGFPGSALAIGGASGNFRVNDLGQILAATGITSSGNITFSGNLVDLTGTGTTFMRIAGGGLAQPQFVVRSPGTKIVLFEGIGPSQTDAAIGMANGNLWHSVPTGSNLQRFTWYGGTTELMRLNGGGRLGIGANDPAALLSVGGTMGNFRVSAGGAIDTAAGIRTTGNVQLLNLAGAGTRMLTVSPLGFVGVAALPSSLANGTVPNSTLRWDGSNWTENNDLLATGTLVGIGSVLANTRLNVEYAAGAATNPNGVRVRMDYTNSTTGTGVEVLADNASGNSAQVRGVNVTATAGGVGAFAYGVNVGVNTSGSSSTTFGYRADVSSSGAAAQQLLSGTVSGSGVHYGSAITLSGGASTTAQYGYFVDASTGGANLEQIGFLADLNGASTLSKTGARLTVSGSTGTIRGLEVFVSGTGNRYAATFEGGNVGIGTNAPDFPLDVVGTVRLQSLSSAGTSMVTASSDGKLNIAPMGSFVDPGTTPNQTLRWNGSEWEANSFLRNSDTSISIGGAIFPGTRMYVNYPAGGVSGATGIYQTMTSSAGGGNAAGYNGSVTHTAGGGANGIYSRVEGTSGSTGNSTGYFAFVTGLGTGSKTAYSASVSGSGTQSGSYMGLTASSGTNSQTGFAADLNSGGFSTLQTGLQLTLSGTSTLNRTGADITVNTGTAVNRGLRVELAGGTGTNYAATFTGGNVGVGVLNPGEALDVLGNQRIRGNVYPTLDNTYDLGSTTNAWRNIYLANSGIGTNANGISLGSTAAAVPIQNPAVTVSNSNLGGTVHGQSFTAAATGTLTGVYVTCAAGVNVPVTLQIYTGATYVSLLATGPTVNVNAGQVVYFPINVAVTGSTVYALRFSAGSTFSLSVNTTNPYAGGTYLSGAGPSPIGTTDLVFTVEYTPTGAAPGLFVNNSNGFVGIATRDPNFNLDVNGATRVTGTLVVGNTLTANGLVQANGGVNSSNAALTVLPGATSWATSPTALGNASDGNLGTVTGIGTTPNNGNGDFQFDLGTLERGILFLNANVSSTGTGTIRYQILTSTNNVNFNIASSQDLGLSTTEIPFNIAVPVNARYIRVVTSSLTAGIGGRMSIAEFQVKRYQ